MTKHTLEDTIEELNNLFPYVRVEAEHYTNHLELVAYSSLTSHKVDVIFIGEESQAIHYLQEVNDLLKGDIEE